MRVKTAAAKILAGSGRHIGCPTAIHDESHVLLELVKLLADRIDVAIRANCRCPTKGESDKSGLDSLLSVAEEEAGGLGDRYIDVKHLVLALLCSKHTVVTQLIKDLDINQEVLYLAAENVLDSRPD